MRKSLARTGAPPGESKIIKCLGCDNTFASIGKFNKLCANCKARNQNYGTVYDTVFRMRNFN